MIFFIDKYGFLFFSLIKHNWEPHGKKPVLKVMKGNWKKASALSALVIPPEARGEMQLLYRFLAQGEKVREEWVKEFLQALLCEYSEKELMVIGDRLPSRKSTLLAEFMKAKPRIGRRFLLSYAPELNPVENAWEYLKYHEQSNYTPATAEELGKMVQERLQALHH